MRLKYDPRLAPEELPKYIPPPSAGAPAGKQTGSNGGALSEGFMGNAGRAWEPARGPDGSNQCPACGCWRGVNGMPYSPEQAARCCTAGADAAVAPERTQADELRPAILRLIGQGYAPHQICRKLGIENGCAKTKVKTIYDAERTRLMKARGMSSREWRFWQLCVWSGLDERTKTFVEEHALDMEWPAICLALGIDDKAERERVHKHWYRCRGRAQDKERRARLGWYR